jgi:hypothetical protein
MKPQRYEIMSRLLHFLDMDTDGLRRFILQSIVEAEEFTVNSLYDTICQRFDVSKKVVASMIGYICSRLGILRVNKRSYRSPKAYMLRKEYADIAKSVLVGPISA